MKNINEYEKKKLLVADFVNHMDKDVRFVIIDETVSEFGEELFDGRLEDLILNKDGVANNLCARIVERYDISRRKHNGFYFAYITLYLEKE